MGRIAAVIALIGGLVTTAAAWHPAAAGVVAAVSGAAGAVGRELLKRRQQRIVERADRRLWQFTSRFPVRYREHVLAELRFIDQKGLATVGFATPELEDVFVDVSLAPRAPHDIGESVLDPVPDLVERRSMDDFLQRPEPGLLAVIGGPGSGKTTLLRHAARKVCRLRKGRRRDVPILLYLREHVDRIVNDGEATIAALVRASLAGRGGDEPPGWFEQRLTAGDCVVLLDGLDEVAKQDDRLRVAAWVEGQIARFPRNDYVLTSRPQGYRDAPIAGATVLQVRQLSEAQVSTFVHRWYRAVERHSTGTVGEHVDRLAAESADDLLARLEHAPAVAELTANPLLLTMIANVHRFRGALPGSRADLYGEICEVMLWRRAEAKRLSTSLPGTKKEALLRATAYEMMCAGTGEISRAAALEIFQRLLRRLSTRMGAEEFLTEAGSNGLLVERENGHYAFAHLTFQEYLAARYIADHSLTAFLGGRVDDPWWRETILLYTAKASADPIVEACLASGTLQAMSLAFACLDDGADLEPGLRRDLDLILERPGRAHRPLRVQVSLSRLQRTLTPVGDTLMTPQPITAALFRLFDPYSPLIADSHPHDPIRGVSFAEARGFAEWVNRHTGSTRYRLPSAEELSARSGTALSAWTPSGVLWFEGPFRQVVTESDVLADMRVDWSIEAISTLLMLDIHQLVHTLAAVPEVLSRRRQGGAAPDGLRALGTSLARVRAMTGVLAHLYREAPSSEAVGKNVELLDKYLLAWAPAQPAHARGERLEHLRQHLRPTIVRMTKRIPIVSDFPAFTPEIRALAGDVDRLFASGSRSGDRISAGLVDAVAARAGTSAFGAVPINPRRLGDLCADLARATGGMADPRVRLLVDAAGAVLARPDSTDPAAARKVRTTALLMMAYAGEDREAARALWHLAAAMTVLTRRAGQDELRTETIILAADRHATRPR